MAIAGQSAATATEAAAEAEARSILGRVVADSFPPLHAVHDLLDVGVCVRCILRMFGAFTYAYSYSAFTVPVLHSFLEENADSAKNGSCSCLSKDEAYCCVCFGLLQLTCLQDQEARELSDGTCPVDDFILMISEVLRRENHQVDGFSLEISLPPVIAANEHAIRLHMKQKYEKEEWFNDKFLCQQPMPVKEALRLLIMTSLENHMNVKSGMGSFRIRLTYTHSEASQRLQYCLPDGRGCKRKNEPRVHGNTFDDCCKRNSRDGDKQPCSKSVSVIHGAIDSMQDHDFCKLFQLPPEKVIKPCHLAITCYRLPIYISGRYLKFSRNVSQSRWIIDDERMGEASVEEIIGEVVRVTCRGDNYKFHAAGREDIDVRMLGSGRPFLVEVSNARFMPSDVDIQQIAEKVNSSDKKYVKVRNLKLVGSEAWNMMREGEGEKQKQYAALVWTSRPLTDDDLQNISSIKDMEILQKTPIRVLHRRSPLERKRIIHWMVIEEVTGSSQYYLMHLCTQAGTYIKELVHGDLGRTHPSIGSLLGCRAEILQLDVTDVKMDFLD